MEDNIDVEENQILENNLENSSKKDLIDEIDSMRDEISSLKDENARTKSNLMWKVRKLEKDKVLIENEKN